uniref:NB-ARC domain-containing protein n=1 Tax=Chenopodium quinoa TaxID=63459 RepID=A0A803MWR1_CHEQI
MSQGVKKIKKKLDAIAYNKQFSFKHGPQPMRNRRSDTDSHVNEADIIERKDDLENIIGMLLDTNVKQNVSFLTVVGIEGLGKTALAQLVYNDPRVKSAFPLRKWTCVADQDQKELDVKEVICKIMGQKFDECYTMDKVQSLVQEQLQGEKYLLVLDDVWTEKHIQWLDLVKYFIGGQRGSWIVVTTRSQKTATIVGGQMYNLQGLSKENSWLLFEHNAFTSEQSNPPYDLVKIGRKIVDRCARVPLAIRVDGSLLYGQDKGKWQSVQEIGLANVRESENGILSILKLSFHHLESPIKCFFSYYALYPKDFEMEKEKLKSLWMAQGYIVPLDKGQSIEDACEEYFSILVRRCFFQDVKKDEFGEIHSCKMHDLMHDITLDVSRKEIFYATNTIRGNLDKKTLNVRGCNRLREFPKDMRKLVKLRLLDVNRCDDLTYTYMPKGMDKLTSLHRLSDFIVGGGGSCSSWKQWFDSLKDLKALNNLKGTLNVYIRWPKKDRNFVKEDDMREGLYMRNTEHLIHILFYFIHEVGDDGGMDENLSLMENLQPHSNLKYLTMGNYNGLKIPGWLTLIPNIVTLKIYNCGKLEYLPCLRNLHNLKSIQLDCLTMLKYIEVDVPSWANSSSMMPMSSGLGSSDKELLLFPSLEEVRH